jgi:hypothetical protein
MDWGRCLSTDCEADKRTGVRRSEVAAFHVAVYSSWAPSPDGAVSRVRITECSFSSTGSPLPATRHP